MNIQVKLKKLPQPSQPIRFDYQSINTNYTINVSNSFETLLQCEDEKTPNELWKEGQNVFLKCAEESISKKRTKINKWITEETLSEVQERKKLKTKGIRNAVDGTRYRQQNAKIQRMMRKDKEKYIKEQCQRIEENAIKNSTKEVYKGVKNLTTKFQPTTDTIKDKDNVILCDRDHVKARWKEYCSKLYKKK